LDHLNKDYHDAMKAKSEFLSRVSHDFRTPLTAIVGFSQLLYEHESELDNTRKQEYLTVIREQSQHLARMIEDMLDVSRMRDGELSLHREATNLRDAVEAAAATLADSGYGNRVEVSVEPRTSPVWADRTELEQALDRLLHAVLAHCEDSAPVSVEVAPSEDRELVQVSIFAPGIDADSGGFATLAAPAEPEATRGASNGRTLGLTFARTLIELHGGRVWLDDNHHAGTAISFVLPAYRRQEAGPKVLVAAAARPQGGATEGAEADGEGNDSGRRSVRAEAHAGQPDLLG
jgi:signal transduction histidine kinase